ncbi:MAG: hypothetical protein QXW91_05430, partial [Candidatus Nitrosotenuis sp.]
KTHPDIGSRVGYPKYSKQFYRITKKLVNEGILDKQGRFIENLPNLWLAELPLHATSKQTEILGNRVPYNIFLALILDSAKKAGELFRTLNFNNKATYLAIKKLQKTELVKVGNSLISPTKEKTYEWLVRYLNTCKIYASTTGDISVLFNAVPAHISGPHAYYMVNYEPGRPIGPSDMKITTPKPFVRFWESVINEVDYFKTYTRHVEIIAAKSKVPTIWIERLPYSKTSSR